VRRSRFAYRRRRRTQAMAFIDTTRPGRAGRVAECTSAEVVLGYVPNYEDILSSTGSDGALRPASRQSTTVDKRRFELVAFVAARLASTAAARARPGAPGVLQRPEMVPSPRAVDGCSPPPSRRAAIRAGSQDASQVNAGQVAGSRDWVHRRRDFRHRRGSCGTRLLHQDAGRPRRRAGLAVRQAR
jgi:hypothetical protein